MDLNDREIKAVISDYRNGSSDPNDCLARFKKLTEIYIYYFPMAAYRKDIDTCSEFYIYMLDRLEGIARNFPSGDDILFKTWFNYCLKNHFSHFIRSGRKTSCTHLSIEDHEDALAMEIFDTEGHDYSFLYDCLSNLREMEKLSLKLFYMPESLTSDEVVSASQVFDLSILEIMEVRGDIIKAHEEERQRVRTIAGKINHANQILRSLKYRLYMNRNGCKSENEAALSRITRYEALKARSIREMESPDRKIFKAFAPLFDSIIKARKSLTGAKKRLKMIILYKANTRRRIY